MEIKLSKLGDPLGYILKVLKRQASALEVLQTAPRPSLAIIYVENGQMIDACHRDVNVAWNRLREAVISAGNAKFDLEEEHDRLMRALTHGVATCQQACDLFDRLCEQYGIPTGEPQLFAKIGSFLHP